MKQQENEMKCHIYLIYKWQHKEKHPTFCICSFPYHLFFYFQIQWSCTTKKFGPTLVSHIDIGHDHHPDDKLYMYLLFLTFCCPVRFFYKLHLPEFLFDKKYHFYSF